MLLISIKVGGETGQDQILYTNGNFSLINSGYAVGHVNAAGSVKPFTGRNLYFYFELCVCPQFLQNINYNICFSGCWFWAPGFSFGPKITTVKPQHLK
jgi:hypothetical protein